MMARHERRSVDELRRRMHSAGVGLVVVGPSTNMTELLSYAPRAVDRLTVLFVTLERLIMVMPDFDVAEFTALTGVSAIGWSDAQGPSTAVSRAFVELGKTWTKARILIDDDLPYRALLELEPYLDGDRAAVSELLASIRLIKSGEAITKIGRAAEIVSAVVDYAIDRCRPGMSEIRFEQELGAELRRRGCQSGEHVIVASGPFAAAPHHGASARTFRAGEAVLFDIAASVDGWWADITQQVFLGEPVPEYMRAYEVLLAAQDAAVRAAVVGAEVGAIYRASRRVIDAAGLGQWTRVRCGHGIGRDVHEPPSLLATNDSPIAEGMTITIEPGIYVPGRFGIRIEDTVAITGGGPVRLTRGARPLAAVDLASG